MAFRRFSVILRRLLFLSGLLLVEIGIIQAVAQTPPTRNLNRAAQYETLRQKTIDQGTVPVLIQLAAQASPFTNQAAPGTAEIDQVARAHIADVQQQVLHELGIPNQEIPHVERFRYIPYMALHVDAAQLDQLFSMEEVLVVMEDFVYEPLLEESTSMIGAVSAWARGGSGEGQHVVVIDTGVDALHPFLEGKVVRQACFSTNYSSTTGNFKSISMCPDEQEEAYGDQAGLHCDASIVGCDHGTRVAGIVAGKGENFSGVARDAGLIAIQVFSRFESYCGENACARSWVSDQIAALEYVYSIRDSLDIAAINMSLGGGHYTTVDHCDLVNPAMYAMFEMLYEAGIPVIAASGNSGSADGLVAPACLSNAISVGSTTKQDSVSGFSSSADFLDFLAPGEQIVSSVPGGGFKPGTGTSFSAPHMAGAWAIVKAKSPDDTIGEIKEAFVKTGVEITDSRNEVEKARIQVDMALQVALLPVELTLFEALAEKERIELRWETASEVNNAGFEVQHRWGDGFVAVAFIPGGGTRNTQREYTYRMENLVPGWHSFRLKQVDFNGTSTYTQTVDAFVELNEAYHMGAAYPNPFNPLTQFTLTIARDQLVLVEVFNVLGEQVALLDDRELKAGQRYAYTLDGSHLASGLYLIRAVGEYFSVTRKVTLLK